MGVHHAQAPPGRAAAARDLADHVEMGVDAELITTEALGLQHFKKAGLLHRGDVLGRKPAAVLGFARTLLEHRRECRGPPDDLLGGDSFHGGVRSIVPHRSPSWPLVSASLRPPARS